MSKSNNFSKLFLKNLQIETGATSIMYNSTQNKEFKFNENILAPDFIICDTTPISIKDYINSNPMGPTGPTGPPGNDGQVGPIGPIGNDGPIGPIGNDGPIGPTGPLGNDGPIGPIGPIGNDGPIGPTGPVGNDGPIGPTGPSSSSYGSYHQEISSDAELLNTTTTFVTKTSMTTSTLPNGKYRIGWYYNWRQEVKHSNIIVEIVQGTNNIMMHEEEPHEHKEFQSMPASGFRYITLTEGSYTFDLRFRSSQNNSESYLTNARLELWLVELSP